jgi:hypothetical protein
MQLPLFEIEVEPIPQPPRQRRQTQDQLLDDLVDQLLERCPAKLHRQLVIRMSAQVSVGSLATQLSKQERLQLLEAIAQKLTTPEA